MFAEYRDMADDLLDELVRLRAEVERLRKANAAIGSEDWKLVESGEVNALRSRVAELEGAMRHIDNELMDNATLRSCVAELDAALEKIEQQCCVSSHPHCLTAYQIARAARLVKKHS